MTSSDKKSHLPAFIKKIKQDKLPSIIVDTFAYYYEQVIAGQTGLIMDKEISPLKPDEIKALDDLSEYKNPGKKFLNQSVRIILNGGLGTSMGLTGPKSLLEVRNNQSFLEILLNQSSQFDITLALMNSFSTHESTLAALEKINPPKPPLLFVQHKFPKILQQDYSPASWPSNPELEWNPPGHGDIYTALITSGMLGRLLDSGITYAFISNSDNLGAAMDTALLGYFAENNFPFMMEVAQRTPADVKGGHLARHRDGYLLLRESAQCPKTELDAFRDINRYRFFNTNNLWINLKFLKELIQKQNTVRLPMILNPKTLDPRDETSPPVFQIETAMGSAISLFNEAMAVCVPRSRFFPVKKCNDLLAVRSDYFLFSDKGELTLNPERRYDNLNISLDPEYFGKIDLFNQRFPQGVPSMLECESFVVKGDVLFESGVIIKGNAVITNDSDIQMKIKSGTVINGSNRK
ncbi:UTP--glucose-1-phosphate uridylyltransferase [Desulfobacterales bacterium HSG17]|nr:UTP--glucose-1-phosphate uridylyltransferase [Desulfobacterales bacterium HSG17]